MAHAYIPSTWEVETGRSWVSGQPGLHSATLSYKQKLEKKRLPEIQFLFYYIIHEHYKISELELTYLWNLL